MRDTMRAFSRGSRLSRLRVLSQSGDLIDSIDFDGDDILLEEHGHSKSEDFVKFLNESNCRFNIR